MDKTYEVRLMKKEEIPLAFSLIYGELSYVAVQDMPRMFSNEDPRPIYFVATIEEKIVGVIATQQITQNNFVWGLNFLFVAPAYKNKGVATLLIHKVVETAQKNNARMVSLSADKKLIPFWKKFQFAPIQGLANNGFELGRIL